MTSIACNGGQKMKMAWRCAGVAGLALLLGGCLSARNVGELRQTGKSNAFTVAVDYESAYSSVLDKMRECWSSGFFMGTGALVEHDIRPSKKTASVSVKVLDAVGINSGVAMLIDINAISDRATSVVVYTDFDTGRPKYQRETGVRGWIEGTRTDC